MPDDAFINELMRRYEGDRDPLSVSGVPASPPVSPELQAALHGPSDPIMQQARGMQAGMTRADPVELAMGLIGPRVRIPNPIKAYHGSPHDFDKFDMSKLLTGEGTNSVAPGLYFAEHEAVAKNYRDGLAGDRGQPRVGGQPYDDLNPIHLATRTAHEEGGPDRARALFDRRISELRGDPDQGFVQRMMRAKQALQSELPSYEGGGTMYEVALHAPREKFVDWEKLLREQPDVLRALAPLDRWLPASELANKPGSAIRQGGKRDEVTADVLRQAGIPGVSYLDGDSRLAGRGTSNYVVWSPEIIEILRKYGILGPAALGAMSAAAPDKNPQQ